jgi:hypothetical protein
MVGAAGVPSITHDRALSPEMFEQIARFAVSDLEIVGADISDEIAGQRVGNQHDRDFRLVEVLDRVKHDALGCKDVPLTGSVCHEGDRMHRTAHAGSHFA